MPHELTHAILSDAEQQRLREMPEDRRRRFTEGRVAIRYVLGKAVNMPPQKVPIEIGEFGKPSVSIPDTFFSLSHTQNRFGLVVANVPVGLDLEWVNPSKDLESVSIRAFGAPITDPKTFFLRWSMMEAHTKLLGESAFRLMPYPHSADSSGSWTKVDSQIKIRSQILSEEFAVSLAIKVSSEKEIELSESQEAPF